MANRPELTKALKSLDINDVLVLAEWDRATRSMQDGLSIIQRVAEKGALIKVLDRQWLDNRKAVLHTLRRRALSRLAARYSQPGRDPACGERARQNASDLVRPEPCRYACAANC